MEDNNNNDFPKVGCGIVSVLVLIFAVYLVMQCTEGANAIISTDGFGIWLLVIGGLALFVYLVYRANGHK